MKGTGIDRVPGIMRYHDQLAKRLSLAIAVGLFAGRAAGAPCLVPDAEFFTNVPGGPGTTDTPFVVIVDEHEPDLRSMHVRVAAAGGSAPHVEVVGWIETWERYSLSWYTTLTFHYCVREIAAPPEPVGAVPVRIDIRGRVDVSAQDQTWARLVVEPRGVSDQVWNAVSDGETCRNVSRQLITMNAIESEHKIKVWARGQWNMDLQYPGPWPRRSAFWATGRVAVTIDPTYEYADYFAVELSPNLFASADFDGDGDIDLRDFGMFANAFSPDTLRARDDQHLGVKLLPQADLAGTSPTNGLSELRQLVETMTGPIIFDPGGPCP